MLAVAVDWFGFLICWPNPTRLTFLGTLYEMLGVLAAAIGISQRMKLFGNEPLLVRFKKWLRGAPIFKEVIYNHVVSDNIKLSVPSVHGYGTVSGPPKLTVEQRIERLEQRTKELSATLSAMRSDLQEKINKTNSRLDEEISGIRADIKSMRERLKEAHGGQEIGIEVVGVILVLIGLPLANFSDELSQAFHSSFLSHLKSWLAFNIRLSC